MILTILHPNPIFLFFLSFDMRSIHTGYIQYSDRVTLDMRSIHTGYIKQNEICQ